jgi:hypothetical protein
VTEALAQLWRTLATVAPKAALFAAILAVGWLVSRVIGRVVANLLLRAGFNRLLDRAGLNKVLGQTYGHELAGKLAYLAALLVTLQLAFGVFGPNPISTLITSVIAFLPKLVVALALIVLATTIASKVKDLVANTIGGLSYANLLANAAKVFVIALGVIAALSQVGVALTVTLPVLIAALGTAAGILVVGVGGGLIKPAQQRWERILEATEVQVDEVEVDEVEVDEATTQTLTVTRTTVE